MEKLRRKIRVRLVNNARNYKRSLSRFDLSKYLIYKLHYKYIKGKLSANRLFTDTDIVLFMKLKKVMFMKIFLRKKFVCF